MKKVLVILGPTATGKTDLGLELAKKFNGELVAADSRQVYKGLDIGTGKMPGEDLGFKKQDSRWEINGVNVWMYDVADPNIRFTVKDYVEQAEKIIEDILKRGKLPIIAGGSGLYLKALLEGLPNLQIPADEKLRGELQKLSLEELQEKLQAVSPIRWKKLTDSDKKNPRRLLRSIELVYMNPYVRKTQHSKLKTQNYQILKIGLTAPRQVLNERIDLRLISRINQGLIKEGEDLHKHGLSIKRMRELGLEYGVLAEFLEGKITREQFIQNLKIKIYQYAKRQMTWFKKEKDIKWFDITYQDWASKVEKLITSWYHQGNDTSCDQKD